VGDTSTAFATILGTYINQRYKDVLRRTNFLVIKEDYAITATSASTVASASTYTLPSNFGKELYVFNSGTGDDIPFLSFEKLEQEYQSQLNNTGTIEYYSIFDTTESTAASAARIKKIRFWRAPSTDNYFTIPYTLSPAALSASSDELVLDCETAVEYGATADAWAYKRQFVKSQYYEALYEKAIQTLMWDKANQPNQQDVMNVLPLDRNAGI
jgi:hypothetical protein